LRLSNCAIPFAVAVADVAGPARALAEVDALERDGGLDSYQYLHAMKAALLERQGRSDEAHAAYRRAFELTRNDAEGACLAGRMNGA
jgi:RNA polymerase sigma-70 factor (ECF subfamily)